MEALKESQLALARTKLQHVISNDARGSDSSMMLQIRGWRLKVSTCNAGF